MLAEKELISSPDTLSLTGCQWRFREADARTVSAMQREHELPEIVARLLVARGVASEDAQAFLNPSLRESLPDPSHLLDMDIAANRVARAIIAKEKIAIFGDYDVDGATSSALLTRYFRALGTDPLIHIPDRMKEGYGPNTPALLSLKERGATLVITVDCGTLSFEPLEAASNARLDVIVIDHHQGAAERPKALAIVNPNRLDETSPHGQLAAVGVAFLLIVAVNRVLREQGKSIPDVKQFLDIVALGTVCDVVPLTGANRAFVAQGLKIMAARNNLGISTILDMASVDEKPGVYACGFIIGPRINAGGRVGKSDLGVRLLTTDDEAEAKSLAAELETHNAERKAIEAMVLEQATLQAETMDAPLLVVCGQNWHPGVIGIVAGRIKERFNKPAAIIAVENGIGKASARSVSGVDFGASVIAAKESGLLIAGGGHAMAAGFTVEEQKIPALTEFLTNHMSRQLSQVAGTRTYTLDGTLSIGGATPELLLELDKLGPFGQANPNIRLCVKRVVNLKPEIVKEHHVKTLFIDPISNSRLFGIAFRCMDTKLGEALLSTRGQTIDVIGQLRLNEWNGKQSVSLHIDDISV